MSWLAAEKALYKQLKDASLGYPIILENDIDDKSKNAKPFIEVYNLPAQTETLDKCLSERYNGFYQISVFTELGKLKAECLSIADSILSAYRVNELPELDGYTVSIDSRSLDTARRDGEFYRCDISINYFLLTGA